MYEAYVADWSWSEKRVDQRYNWEGRYSGQARESYQKERRVDRSSRPVVKDEGFE